MLVEILGESEVHQTDYFHGMIDFPTWQVKEARGIPNTGRRLVNKGHPILICLVRSCCSFSLNYFFIAFQ